MIQQAYVLLLHLVSRGWPVLPRDRVKAENPDTGPEHGAAANGQRESIRKLAIAGNLKGKN